MVMPSMALLTTNCCAVILEMVGEVVTLLEMSMSTLLGVHHDESRSLPWSSTLRNRPDVLIGLAPAVPVWSVDGLLLKYLVVPESS